ncbi:hypothetical protein HG15A2_47440 [Adhaeretor mobilis]|uniref:Uncharacterized protein n=1 Tax=Adhaeretor mobilis TaxID=1930276 RepID=A0A517N2P5_9BACT|nr:hypothetical protein HG15A2_47440 [Adhaeretor mobilis]
MLISSRLFLSRVIVCCAVLATLFVAYDVDSKKSAPLPDPHMA